jgi:hypothetical protein
VTSLLIGTTWQLSHIIGVVICPSVTPPYISPSPSFITVVLHPSPFGARLLLTNKSFRYYEVPIGLVFSIHDSTEVAIQKMIDASQGIITMGSQGEGMSPPMKKHLELEIKILQNAPRDPDKLERLLQIRQRQKEEAMYIEDTQRLVAEIEMLKVVLYLVSRKQQQ